MKKMINKSRIEGILYESDIKERVFGSDSRSPGGKYVSGRLSIEVAEDNIVNVEIFENEITKAGKRNQKYDTLLSLIGAKSILANSREEAVCLSIDSALSLNDWYPQGELVSTLQNFNGFINLISMDRMEPKATFDADMLITSTSDSMTRDVNGNYEPDGNLLVKGYIFDFASRVLPVEFLVENEAGIEYFQDLPSNTFTKVWGKQETHTKSTSQVQESAFGEDKVIEQTRTQKKFIITGTNVEPYMFGEPDVLTVEEVQEAVAARNVYLADKKAEGEQPRKTPTAATVVADPTNVSFDF